MTKNDFFRIIIKLFGLYSLILSLFRIVPSIFSLSLVEVDLWSILSILLSVAIISAIYIFLLNKPDLIIRWLRLDKGFDDPRIDLGNFNSNQLVSFATILIGGFLVVDYFPSLLKNILDLFKESVQPDDLENLIYSYDSGTRYFDLTISILNTLIGYLLLTNYRNVSKWILKVNNENKG